MNTKYELITEVSSILSNLTGRTFPEGMKELDFIEYNVSMDNLDFLKQSIRTLLVLIRILEFSGWKLDPSVEPDDLQFHLTKDGCFVRLSVTRFGLCCFFDEIH